jgi:hypothetical protein
LGTHRTLAYASTEDARDPIPTLAQTTQSAAAIFSALLSLASGVATFQSIGTNLIGGTARFAASRPRTLTETSIAHHVDAFTLTAGATAAVWTTVSALAVRHTNTFISLKRLAGVTGGGREANALLSWRTTGHGRGPDPAIILLCTTGPLLSTHAANSPFNAVVTRNVADSLFAGARFRALTALTAAAVATALLALTIGSSIATGPFVADLTGTAESAIFHWAPATLRSGRLAGLTCVARVHRSRGRTGPADFAVDLLHYILALTLCAAIIGAFQTVVTGAAGSTAAVISANAVVAGGRAAL